jgi:hypothetical protein
MKLPHKTKKQTSIDTAFWRKFSRSAWEKKAGVWKDIDSPLRQIEESRVFAMLVEFADLCRQRKNSEGFKLYLEGERQHPTDTLQFLPKKQDRSLLGYHHRMEALFPDYCLVCDELLQVSLESWNLLLDFLQGLYREIGLPNRFSEIGLYLGNYKKTPFGVHVDGCGVFSFPAVGTKKFRLWTPQYIQKNPDLVEAHEYEKFKKGSEVLLAKPGDMTYWPSQAWHIAESDGGFSATWSLGVWVDRPHSELLAETMIALFSKALGDGAEEKTVLFEQLHSKKGEVESLPPLYQRSASVLQSLSPQEAQDLFLKAWMKVASKQGLKNIPTHKAGKKLSPLDKLMNRLPTPILWSHISAKKQICLAFNGQIFVESSSAELRKLIEDLNSSKVCQVGKHLKLLQQLFEAGALGIDR